MQEASTVATRSQAKKAGESIPLEIQRVPMKIQSLIEKSPNRCNVTTRAYRNMGSGATSSTNPLIKRAVDQIQRFSEALTQEQVRGAEREEAMGDICRTRSTMNKGD